MDDYPMLERWWKSNLFRPPGIDGDLPVSNGKLQGIIVSGEGKDICAGFIIDTNVPNGCMIEYVVADFEEKDRDLRKKSQNYLIDVMCDLCRDMGKKYIYTTTAQKGLMDRYVDCGFIKGSENVTEFVKAL